MLTAAAFFLQPFAALRTRNGDDVVPLCEHPGQRELRGRAPFSRGDARDALDDREVLPEVVAWNRGLFRRQSSGAKSSATCSGR